MCLTGGELCHPNSFHQTSPVRFESDAPPLLLSPQILTDRRVDGLSQLVACEPPSRLLMALLGSRNWHPRVCLTREAASRQLVKPPVGAGGF